MSQSHKAKQWPGAQVLGFLRPLHPTAPPRGVTFGVRAGTWELISKVLTEHPKRQPDPHRGFTSRFCVSNGGRPARERGPGKQQDQTQATLPRQLANTVWGRFFKKLKPD